MVTLERTWTPLWNQDFEDGASYDPDILYRNGLYQLKEAFKAGGWVVELSCDGVVARDDGTDLWTSPSDITVGLNNGSTDFSYVTLVAPDNYIDNDADEKVRIKITTDDTVGALTPASFDAYVASGPYRLASTALITLLEGADMADGDYFTIDDGTNPALSFEFDDDASVTPGRVGITFTGTETFAEMRALIVAAINGASPLNVKAFDDKETKEVALALTYYESGYTPALTENVTDAGFTVINFSGNPLQDEPIVGGSYGENKASSGKTIQPFSSGVYDSVWSRITSDAGDVIFLMRRRGQQSDSAEEGYFASIFYANNGDEGPVNGYGTRRFGWYINSSIGDASVVYTPLLSSSSWEGFSAQGDENGDPEIMSTVWNMGAGGVNSQGNIAMTVVTADLDFWEDDATNARYLGKIKDIRGGFVYATTFARDMNDQDDDIIHVTFGSLVLPYSKSQGRPV